MPPRSLLQTRAKFGYRYSKGRKQSRIKVHDRANVQNHPAHREQCNMSKTHPNWKDWQQAIRTLEFPCPADWDHHTKSRDAKRLIHSARVLLTIRDRQPLSLTDTLRSCEIFSPGSKLHPLLEKNARELATIVENLIHTRLVIFDPVQKSLSTTEHFADVQGILMFSLRHLCETKETPNDDLGLAELAKTIQEQSNDLWFTNDLVHSLTEAGECYLRRNHIACLCLCGKVIEICLKVTLVRHGPQALGDPNAGVGQIIGRLRKMVPSEYVDDGLKDVCNLINKSRIPAVHFKEEIPIPSRDQATMVVSATVDTVRRLITQPDDRSGAEREPARSGASTT